MFYGASDSLRSAREPIGSDGAGSLALAALALLALGMTPVAIFAWTVASRRLRRSEPIGRRGLALFFGVTTLVVLGGPALLAAWWVASQRPPLGAFTTMDAWIDGELHFGAWGAFVLSLGFLVVALGAMGQAARVLLRLRKGT